ncbi:class I SAM-dependent methyltransferase [Pseudomonas putida]|uniref:class I SAM-dependent methyltransferase n=1 Tax=Pseudomonas putida TaxID=303 RepID=UPI0037CABD5B
MDLKETEILGKDIDQHWYYSAKAKAMTYFLGNSALRKIVDVGAGSGFFSRYLLKHTSAIEAWCIDISYAEDADELISEKPVYLRKSIGENDADLVLLMDVLEHVDDDVALLTQYVEKAPIGTRFLLTVPAFQFLWSSHDVFLEHRRRYSLPQLEKVASEAGLEIRRGAYYFAGVFPLVAALRLIERIKPNTTRARTQLARHSLLTNWALKLICLVELPIMRLNRLGGVSAFCLAEKR